MPKSGPLWHGAWPLPWLPLFTPTPSVNYKPYGLTLFSAHSDRGDEFASGVYRKMLASHGLLASMSHTGNCYDNAHIESFWSSLKHELIYRQRFGTRAEARSAIFDYIESFYNRSRLHSSLGYQSPLDFEAQLN